MMRSRILAKFFVLLLGAGACLSAQSGSKPAKTWTVPAAVPPEPFDAETPARKPVFSVEFRPAAEMSEQDRLLAADAQAAVAEHAGMHGMEFSQGTWSYQQVVCPALPGHLFLQYARNNGTGDVSVFSAAIPRGGEGRVRIVPILRRGYSLFSPTPINALTIAAFNHIRAEEPGGDHSDWMGNALCYAALAGARPEVTVSDAVPAPGKPVPAVTPVLVIRRQGGERIRFADQAAKPRAMEWTMTFTQQGKLVKASRDPSPMASTTVVPAQSPVRKTWAVPVEAAN